MDTIDLDRIKFFEIAQEGFERAERAAGETIVRDYGIAGQSAQLRFAGPALVPKLTSALAHLESSERNEPGLTIHLWDSKSTHTPLPLMLESLVDLLRLRWFERLDIRKEIKGYHGGRLRTIFHLGPDILSIFDVERRRALYWVESEEQVPYYEAGYPLTPLLGWWLEERGFQLLHAAAVGGPEGGVIICGKGGSGKSTTALSCIGSELGFLGDDYCALDARGRPEIWSLYCTSKLKGEEDVERFSHLKRLITNPDRLGDEKALIFLQDPFPSSLIRRFPLKAVFVPRITGRPNTEISDISMASALKALAPSTMFQLPGNGPASLKTMSRLVRSVPCHHLDLGTDIAEIPRVIAGFLAQH